MELDFPGVEVTWFDAALSLLAHFGTVAGFVLAVFLLTRIYRERERPSTTIAWLLALILIPYVGVPLYLLIGGRKVRKMAAKKHVLYERRTEPAGGGAQVDADIERALVTCNLPPARGGVSVELLSDGEISYAKILELIDGAETSIDIMTFIVGRDEVGREIVRRLAAKASQGVRVRLLLDALGCIYTRGGFVQPIRDAGGEVGIFMPMLPLQTRWSANLRNHRKSMIFDGRTAVIGGMNLAAEYMGPSPDPARWIDTCALIEGPVVEDFIRLFRSDWAFATHGAEDHAVPEVASVGLSRAQVAPNGPDVEGDPLYDALLTAIHGATRRVWIVTPYFVPDEGLWRALVLQARLGRDVRLIMPMRSNHRLADYARARFVRDLHEAGARIELHPTKMIHAKYVVIDDEVAITGSANFDMRSLYLNYEIGFFTYTEGDVLRVAEWCEGLMKDCVRYHPKAAPWARRWAEDIAWFLAPLL